MHLRMHTGLLSTQDAKMRNGTISTNIVAAKTRVSPNIVTNIPRLELMGAIAGVRLTTRILDVLGEKMEKKLLSGVTASMFCGGFEDEAVISSLSLPTELEKYKHLHSQRNGGMSLQR